MPWWPGRQLLTNRRCPESLAGVVASNNTLYLSIWHSRPIVAAFTTRVYHTVSIVRKDETTPIVNYLG